MKLPCLVTATVLMGGVCAANDSQATDAIAYHQIQPATISLPAIPHIPLGTPPLDDPLTTTATFPAKVLPIHSDSGIENVTAIIGTIGMLLLVFRRRLDSMT